MADWSTRIPAAIEKAERILGRRETAECVGEGAVFIPRDSPDRTITRNEVALAKVLFQAHHEAVYKILRTGWDEHEAFETRDGDEPCTHCAPLRVFTEKVEAL